MKQFTEVTADIIRRHKDDFNEHTFNAFMQEHGGLDDYLIELGGVFARHSAGTILDVRTTSQLQEAAEWCWGLWAIYGVSYNNGVPIKGRRYYYWGDKYTGDPAPDSFYQKPSKGACNWGTMEELLTTKGKTINCNYGLDAVLIQMGLFSRSGYHDSCNVDKLIKTAAIATIRDKKDLRPGDIVEMYKSKLSGDDPTKWSGWYHVALVGEVTDDEIIMYDCGSRFARSGGTYKYAVPRSGSSWGTYDNSLKGWVGIRVRDIEDDSVTDEDIAVEAVSAMTHFYDVLITELGEERADRIMDMAADFMDDAAAYARAAARYVLEGRAGAGGERKAFFGSLYEQVQAKVNDIIEKSDAVLMGAYGNGEERIAALGDDYEVVQWYVNKRLRGGK